VVGGRAGVGADGLVVLAPDGDRARRVLEGAAAAVRELERDDGLVAALLVEVLLRVADVGARERRVVLDDPPAVGQRRGLALGVGRRLLVAQDEDALGDREELRPGALAGLERLAGLGLRGERLPLEQRAVGLVEDVGARLVGRVVVLVALRIAAGGLLDGPEEPRDRRLAAVDLRRVRPALVVEDVRFPVVEEELGGRPDLGGRAVGVLDAREVHLEVAPGEQQLGLRDAEGVDPLAQEAEGPVERLLGDGGLRLGRLALVDELDAALEVEAELGLLRRDDRDRPGDEAEDQQEDEEIATAIGHGGGQSLLRPITSKA
jgi:hypothetical protein